MTDRSTSRAVPLAAVGLVAAVVGALLLARTPDRSGPAAVVVDMDWNLADDSLLGFVEIPAGPFVMGSDPERDPLAYENERWSRTAAQGEMELPTFYIGRFEVTVAQFEAFLASSTHRPLGAPGLDRPPDHPVTGVSWPDALAYAEWLQGQLATSEETPAPVRQRLENGWKVTLPTEVQWEKAARGSDGRVFPWGDAPRPDRANLRGQGTLPVGSFPCPECPYPVSDMSGNVWEWTRSPLQPYPYSESDDAATITADALWVMRGGAFNDSEQNARTATRGGADPGARRPFLGFRVVLTPE